MRGINFDSPGWLTHNRPVNEPLRAWWADAVVWDNHACMPLRADDAFLPQLERCRQSGIQEIQE